MEIHDSRDETQRVVTLTYNNVKQNKDGKWTGTPITVDRSINDIIPVDDALNESMLNPSLLKGNLDAKDDESKKGEAMEEGGKEIEINTISEGKRKNEAEIEDDETNDVLVETNTENDDTKEGTDETNNDIE